MGEYIVGIDGGGTKTTAKVVFRSERPPIVLTGGPLNICSVARSEAAETVRLLLGRIGEQAGPDQHCTGICIGAAGFSNPETAPFLKECVERYSGVGNARVTSDAYIAMCGALKSTTGAVLIAGTGSVCQGLSARGEFWQAGGAGHLIDDEGGGYAIGRDILSAVVRDLDGRGPGTVLTSMLKRRRGLGTLADIVDFTYGDGSGKAVVASLAPLLAEACDCGDRVAVSIAERAVRELLRMAEAVIGKLSLEDEAIAFCGSVLRHVRHISAPLARELTLRYPKLSIVSGDSDPVDGAVYLAALPDLSGNPLVR
mgnify:CR=1 FL=1